RNCGVGSGMRSTVLPDGFRRLRAHGWCRNATGCHFGTCPKRNSVFFVGYRIQSKTQLSNPAGITAYANLERKAGMALAIRFLQIPRSKREFATRTLRN